MTVNKTLSQTLGALKKGYRANNAFESFPVCQTMKNVVAVSATHVLAATTLASGVVTTVSGSITDPDVYRALRVTGNAVGIYGNVVITGKDRGGKVVTDTIIASGNTTVDGVVPMSEVIQVVLPARTTVGDTVSVGISGKLGLYRPVDTSADVIEVERKASAATSYTEDGSAGTVDATYGTITPSGVITAGDSFRFNYETKIF